MEIQKEKRKRMVRRGKVATLKFTVVKFTDDFESGRKFLVIRYRLQEHSVADKNEHKFVCEWGRRRTIVRRGDNKFRRQFDKVLEKYQATMHRTLGRRYPSPFPPFSSPYYFFSPTLFVLFVFLFFILVYSSPRPLPVRRTRPLFPFFLYIFIIYTHASRVSHAVPSFWYIETLIHPFPGTTPA